MKKTVHTEITLLSSRGKETVPATFYYIEDEETFYPESEITLIFDGKEYKGQGTDYLLVDTYADLQKKLPDGVKIACCMTCRHGNMCPYGTGIHEIFCTEGIEIKLISKDDMYDFCNLFSDHEWYSKHEVLAYNCCDKFVYLSDDDFTYNDFLYRLNEKQ